MHNMNIRKFLLQFQNTFFYWVLEKNLNTCETVLDVGCGHSSALGKIKRKFKSEGIEVSKDFMINLDKYGWWG